MHGRGLAGTAEGAVGGRRTLGPARAAAPLRAASAPPPSAEPRALGCEGCGLGAGRSPHRTVCAVFPPGAQCLFSRGADLQFNGPVSSGRY